MQPLASELSSRLKRYMWPLWPLLLLWFGVPLLARCVMLAGQSQLGLLAWVGAVAIGSVQDAALLGQFALIILALRAWPRLALPLAWFGLSFYLNYVLFDLMLYGEANLRMSYTFFLFLRDAASFFGSMGRWQFWGGLSLMLFVCGLSIVVLWLGRHCELRLGRRLGIGVFMVNLAATVSYQLAPGAVVYWASNVVFNDQQIIAERLLGIEDPLLQLAEAKDGDKLWLPPIEGERFELGADQTSYPLYRHTQETQGEKLFELKVEKTERPHVIVLVMESFRGADVGVLGGQYGVTPRFDGLAGEGILFRQFYATGVQTTRALLSIGFGVLPRYSERSVQSAEPKFNLRGLPQLFHDAGYTTAYLHNGELDFESMGEFLTAHDFDEVVGDEDLLAWRDEAPSFSWGVHDEVLMDYILDWLAAKDAADEPSFVLAFTISNHHPWTLPETWDPIDLEISAEESYGKFLRAMHYSDACLGALVDGLRARGLAKDTILLITADTSQAMGERDDNYAISRGLYHHHVHIPLLILADGRLDAARQVEQVGSQVDILPTLVDILGLSGVHHSQGRSLQRKHDGKAYFNSPFALGYWGLRWGKWLYFYTLRTEESALYDLQTDPLQQNNLASQESALVETMRLDLARMHRAMRWFYDESHFAPR